jgi:hypothetical protein
VLSFLRIIKKTKGDFLFANEHRPWIKNQLLKTVVEVIKKHLAVRLTVLSWRYVAIATSDEHLRKASRIWR